MLHERADHQPACLARGAFGSAGVVLGAAPGVDVAGAGLAGLVGGAVMRFGSVCSGIEAASVAFEPLGWSAAWLAEIEPFPSAVLAHHYPDVPNLGDMTAIPRRLLAGEIEAPDMLCGGTPCQAFSVAGLRESLSDERGNLTITFVEIADAIDHVRGRRGDEPAIILWENVPGVLSTKDNAFGCFLAGLAGEDDALQPPGGKWANAGAVYGPARAIAWRTLDAQYFGLAQRRRRVFVVASARDGFDPATVLFEWDGVRRDTAPSREAGEDAAGCLASRTDGGGFPGTDEACGGYVQPVSAFCIKGAAIGRKPEAGPQYGEVLEDICYTQNCVEQHAVACTMRGDGFDAREDGTGRGTPLVPVGVTIHGTDPTVQKVASYSEVAQCLRARTPGNIDNSSTTVVQQPVAYGIRTANTSSNGWGIQEECTHTLDCAQGVAVAQPVVHAIQAGALRVNPASGPDGVGVPMVATTARIRRITPLEAERLMGFPDNYTAIPWRNKPADQCPDGPRYKALGNSWAVPCVRWIGRRIQRQIDRKVA